MGSVLIGSALAAATGATLYNLGLFDRPTFEEKILVPELYLFLACTRTKNIGGNVMRLLKGTRSAVETFGEKSLITPAAKYGAPDGAHGLKVGIFLDNPKTTENPRWGIGWAVEADNIGDLKAMQSKVNEANTLEEPIRVVKIGGGEKILSGRIPWRFYFTPSIAPMLHWGRAFKAYDEGGYKSMMSKEAKDESTTCWDGAIACEIYVHGKNNSMEYIDYVVLLENTEEIVKSMFPSE